MSDITWDYIIIGGGLAGLSLAYRFSQNDAFSSKKILLLEPQKTRTNDRTWSFWEANAGLFEDLVFKRWSHLHFASPTFEKTLDIAPYEYKTIRGIDFYEHCLQAIRLSPNIEIRHESVQSINHKSSFSQLVTNKESYKTEWIFDSLPPNFNTEELKNHYFLWQHFKGLVIETETDTFDPEVATFMDFRIEQANETRFFYVLPYGKRKAMIEYTIFGLNFWEQNEYDSEIADYLQNKLSINNYTILHEEIGKIPMTDFDFPKGGKPKHIKIGTPGGKVKASSGYAFVRIQKHLDLIVKDLEKNEIPTIKTPLLKKRFEFYDKVLFNTMITGKVPAWKTFSLLFKRNKPTRVLKFLDEDTPFIQDYLLINTTPIHKFMWAAAEEITGISKKR